MRKVGEEREKGGRRGGGRSEGGCKKEREGKRKICAPLQEGRRKIRGRLNPPPWYTPS